jgi:hypothetical protein
MKMWHRGVMFVAAILMGSVALAGQAAAPAQASDPAKPQSDPAKPQVRTFEMVLRTAIETAGQNVARRARQMAPDFGEMMTVAFAAGQAPVVNGIADHELGLYAFQVQVPNIALSLRVLDLMLSQPGGRVPVGGGRVSADGLVTPDPLDPDPSARLEREYRALVRDALIDAILDNAAGLLMKPTDTLLIVASGIDPVVPNALERRAPASSLVLKVKASDLAEFREGKIKKEDVRGRIQSRSF